MFDHPMIFPMLDGSPEDMSNICSPVDISNWAPFSSCSCSSPLFPSYHLPFHPTHLNIFLLDLFKHNLLATFKKKKKRRKTWPTSWSSSIRWSLHWVALRRKGICQMNIKVAEDILYIIQMIYQMNIKVAKDILYIIQIIYQIKWISRLLRICYIIFMIYQNI